MTRFDPSIVVNRLLVQRGDKFVYDEHFHKGVNIIRGGNSVGKSTIANLTFYVLGGEGIDWVQEALLCQSVFAEVELNGATVTLQREISEHKDRPMKICWDSFENSQKGTALNWQLYPFAARTDTESFSQVLFTALNIPQVRGDAARLTMNQLLRLMFVDQNTSPSEIFRFEQFTRKDTLDAIGSLLCGAYDDRIYEIGLTLSQLRTERDEIHGELKVLWKLIEATDQTEGLAKLKQYLELTREALKHEYEVLNERTTKRWDKAALKQKDARIKEVLNELQAANEALVRLERERQDLLFEIEDSAQFISAIENNLEALNDSSTTRSMLGEIDFTFCPACFNEIAPNTNAHCPLCKSPIKKKDSDSRLLRMRQELRLQLRESAKLQQERMKRKAELDAEIPSLHNRRDALTLQYDETATRIGTPEDDAIAEGHRKLGYLTRQIEDLEKQVQLASTIDQLEARRAELEAEMSRLTEERLRREESRLKKQEDANATIRELVAALLRSDELSEAAFANASPEDIDFNFGENRISVMGRTNFSASSKVILKNSFHLALVIASTEKEYFRYPRFAIFDAIEDKGMTPERSHRFQRLIVEMSNNAPSEHQIIFTTSMIDPELEQTDLVVGDHYTPDHKSLRIQSGIKPP